MKLETNYYPWWLTLVCLTTSGIDENMSYWARLVGVFFIRSFETERPTLNLGHAGDSPDKRIWKESLLSSVFLASASLLLPWHSFANVRATEGFRHSLKINSLQETFDPSALYGDCWGSQPYRQSSYGSLSLSSVKQPLLDWLDGGL